MIRYIDALADSCAWCCEWESRSMSQVSFCRAGRVPCACATGNVPKYPRLFPSLPFELMVMATTLSIRLATTLDSAPMTVCYFGTSRMIAM